MKAADAKILAEDLIALNALTNSSYVSNHGIQEAARLAGIIVDLAIQIEAFENIQNAPDPTIEALDITKLTPKPRGRPRKVKDE